MSFRNKVITYKQETATWIAKGQYVRCLICLVQLRLEFPYKKNVSPSNLLKSTEAQVGHRHAQLSASHSKCTQFPWAHSKHRRHTIHPLLSEWLFANDPQRFLFCLSHVFPFSVCSFLLRLFRWLVVYSFHCFALFWMSALFFLQSIRERIHFQLVLFLEFSLC